MYTRTAFPAVCDTVGRIAFPDYLSPARVSQARKSLDLDDGLHWRRSTYAHAHTPIIPKLMPRPHPLSGRLRTVRRSPPMCELYGGEVLGCFSITIATAVTQGTALLMATPRSQPRPHHRSLPPALAGAINACSHTLCPAMSILFVAAQPVCCLIIPCIFFRLHL